MYAEFWIEGGQLNAQYSGDLFYSSSFYRSVNVPIKQYYILNHLRNI